MFDSSMVNEPSGFDTLKFYCNLNPEVRDILQILCKRGEITP